MGIDLYSAMVCQNSLTVKFHMKLSYKMGGKLGPPCGYGDLVVEDRCDLKKWQVPDQ